MKEDWVEVELGDICDFVGGGTPSKSNPLFWNGDLPWASIKDIKNDYLKTTQDCITDEGLKNSSANIAMPNEIILATRINPGKPIISKIKTAINQDLKVVKTKIDIDSKFLFYSLKELEKDIVKVSSGTTVLGVNLNNLRTINYNLPPLPIQRAIVSRIETLFSDLDKGIADLKKAQEQLKIYRQAVLKKAFEGEWKLVRLEQVSDAMGGYAFKSKSFLEIGKYQVIRIGNVRPGIIRYNASPVFINEIEEKLLERYLLKKNDIVISLTGTRTKRDYGFTAIITTDNLLLNQRLAYIRLTENYLPKFFLYFSWSEPFKIQFFGSETGNTGQGNVGMKSIKETMVPLPSIQEQHQIVREIESRLSVCGKVEQNISEALDKAEALRQSILKKAFEGKLLSKAEIEACRQEADYEPASVLLERIRKESPNEK